MSSLRHSKSIRALSTSISMTLKHSPSIRSFKNSVSRSGSSEVFQKPEETYLFTVVAIKEYSAASILELSFKPSDTFHVIEEKEYFYYCSNSLTKEEGYIPKNYVQLQKALPILPAVINIYFKTPTVTCIEGEMLILLARVDEHSVYFKKMNTRIQQTGIITISVLTIDGDVNTLPTMSEYESRKVQNIKSATNSGSNTPKTRSRANSKTFVPANQAKEDRIMEKLKTGTISRSKSSNFLSIFVPSPEY
eukprot:NODE_301_length_11418_cov_0.342521.p5 type:complete len:249 gc:universal NODE_301_length_11418_cov_0.342521:9221-8475(-)